MKTLRLVWRRARLAYHVRCAREDARLHGLIAPLGVWVCERCEQVSLSLSAHAGHAITQHA